MLLPWQPVDCWLVYSVCSVPSYSSVTVSGYLQGKRGGKAPNHVIDSPPSPQPMLALEILGWMMVCVCVQGGKKSRPQTTYFACALWPRRKIGSGHLYCENWGIIIKHISTLLHQSDCSREINYVSTSSQIASLHSTSNWYNTINTADHCMSTCPSFPSESVQILFQQGRGAHTKNFVWGLGRERYM